MIEGFELGPARSLVAPLLGMTDSLGMTDALVSIDRM